MSAREGLARADWQRSDAMVLFTEMTAQAFPLLLERVTDEDIRSTTRTYEAEPSPLDAARAIAPSLYPIEAKEWSSIQSHIPELTLDTKGNLAEFTFAQYVVDGMREAAATVVYLPLNILGVARRQLYGADPALYPTIGAVADTLRKPWFHDVCHDAAFAPNGIWRGFSASQRLDENLGPYAAYLQFEKTDIDEYSFKFTEFSLEALRSGIKKVNAIRRYRERLQRGPGRDSYNGGSSSGCPVAHHRPHYGGRQPDAEQMSFYEETFGKSADELLAPRDRTGIDISLDTLADLLDRAHKLGVLAV